MVLPIISYLRGRLTWRQSLARKAVLGLLLLLGAGGVVRAAPFAVNNAGDGVDFAPGDGVCETGSGTGDCTLPAAIQETNMPAGNATIALPASTHFLPLAGAAVTSAAGDLDNDPN